MKSLALYTALLLSSLQNQIGEGYFTRPLGVEELELLSSGWQIEEVLPDRMGPGPSDLILLSNGQRRCFISAGQRLSKEPFDSYNLTYTGTPERFILELRRRGKSRLYLGERKLGQWDSVEVSQAAYGTLPHLLLRNGDHFQLYDGSQMLGPYTAKSGKLLSHSGSESLALLKLHSRQINGEWNSRVQLIENGVITPVFHELLESGLSSSGEIRYLYRETGGSCRIKEGISLSARYRSSGAVEIPGDQRPLFYLQSVASGEWWLYDNGRKFGPYSNEPEAAHRLSDGRLVWAAPEGNQWLWFKEGVPIVESDPFDFQSDDIHFYENRYALIRKRGNSYEVYADFRKRLSFAHKPGLKFINETLLEVTGSAESGKSFRALYQLDVSKLYPMNGDERYRIYENGYFDFWMQQEGYWTAYREGIALGRVKAETEDQIACFVIRNTLFFPDWNHNESGMVMLNSPAGFLGPFNSLTPLERPADYRGESRLFSSFTAQTDEGELALYTDAIIGPYDRVYPNRDFQNPDKVLGLFIEVANIFYYYTRKEGMVLQDSNRITAVDLQADGSLIKSYETGAESPDSDPREQTGLPVTISIAGKEEVITSDWQILEDRGKNLIRYRTEAGSFILLPSGLNITGDQLFLHKLHSGRELLVYSDQKRGKLLLNAPKQGVQLRLDGVSRLSYFSSLTEKPTWLAVERELYGELQTQIYYDNKAVFLLKQKEAADVSYREFAQAGCLMMEFPAKGARQLQRVFLTAGGVSDRFHLTRNGFLTEHKGSLLKIYPLPQSD